MQKLSNKVFQFLSMLIILILISGFISVRVHAASELTVNGNVKKGKIEVELTNDNVADTIIINLFPNDKYFAEQFVGFNFVYPGLKSTGDFIITNNTGQAYKVTDFSFEADAVYIHRVYNDAAKYKYGDMSTDNYNIVKNLSGEEWYQLNADYYGVENFYNIDVARNILGFGDFSQGLALGIETSSELIELGEWYLFNKSQFSFDTNKYPINNLEVKNITLQDYIDKTSNNTDLVLNSCFSQEIGESGFTSKIGYSIDNASVGNAYNGAYSDFKFTLTLSRVIEGVTVSYNGNGNTGGIAPVDNNLYETGSSVVILDNIGHLVKEGFTFNEWNTSPNGNGTQLKAGETFFIDNDIILYASWVPVTNPQPPITFPPPTTPPPITAPPPTTPPPITVPPPTTPPPIIIPPTTTTPPSITIPPTATIPPPTTPRPQLPSPETTEIIVPGTSLNNLEDFNHVKYIYGYPDGLVRPDNGIVRSEAVSIFFRLLTDSIKNDAYPLTFNDVSDGRWYSQAVSYLAYIGVLTGYEDGTFRPDAPITRAEFATIASRFDALAAADENIFFDVPDDHWATKYINSAYKKGWINGYDNGYFKPEQNITRVEAVKLVNTMLNRLVKPENLDDSLNPFIDITRAHWGFAHILEASIEHSYIKSDDDTEIWKK